MKLAQTKCQILIQITDDRWHHSHCSVNHKRISYEVKYVGMHFFIGFLVKKKNKITFKIKNKCQR